ncbi:basic form of pathogenesis-related protein 1-like [Camellia sinensis]|uniref:basic form of pathogenesis-related protein 1-like n=1 Tax=Camellia sinensis TaxID=4442 RepID=UPI0010368A6D|nr:basic form of pathogenesis-related protein 1-like [Camellia sinensis]
MEFSLALVGLMSLDLSQDYLNAHNAARAQVGVGPKTWDNNVSFYAQSYAKSRMGDCNPINSGGPYEENLAMSSGLFTDTDAVNLYVFKSENMKKFFYYIQHPNFDVAADATETFMVVFSASHCSPSGLCCCF